MNRPAIVEADRDRRRRGLFASDAYGERLSSQRFEAALNSLELRLCDSPVTGGVHWRDRRDIVAPDCQPRDHLIPVESHLGGAQSWIMREGGSRRQNHQNHQQADRRPETREPIISLRISTASVSERG